MHVKNKRILVTGGAGFIGSHLVDAIAQENDMVVLDDFSSGERKNLERWEKADNVRIVEGDIQDKGTVERCMKGVDLVFHLAVRCLRLSIKDPYSVHEVNATGTLNVCDAALRENVERFVYISSSEVYGSAKYTPMDEKHPLDPTTPYGASKAAGDLYASSFYHTHGLQTVVVRPFNVYGPRSHTEGPYGEVIPRFVASAMKGEPPTVFGDGTQSRDFTYVSDTVGGIRLCAEKDVVGEVLNIGHGDDLKINEVAKIILGVLGRDVGPEHTDPRPGDVYQLYADISKANKLLGYKPKVGFREGIEKYVDWIKEEKIDLTKLVVKERNW